MRKRIIIIALTGIGLALGGAGAAVQASAGHAVASVPDTHYYG